MHNHSPEPRQGQFFWILLLLPLLWWFITQRNPDAPGDHKKTKSIIVPKPTQTKDDLGLSTPYITTHKMPRFDGCDAETPGDGQLDHVSRKALLDYIFNEVEYPHMARETGLSGTVVSQFTITKSGKMQEIKIIKSLGGGCDEEVLRILDKMNATKTWLPGKIGDAPVNVRYVLPVKFQLE